MEAIKYYNLLSKQLGLEVAENIVNLVESQVDVS